MYNQMCKLQISKCEPTCPLPELNTVDVKTAAAASALGSSCTSNKGNECKR